MPNSHPDRPAAPWAAVAAVDQEKLCRELGAGRLAVWFRLSLCAMKAGSPTFAVSRRELAYDCGLTREAVRQHLADLARAGFVEVEHDHAEGRGDVANRYTVLRGPYSHPWPKNGPPVAKKPELSNGHLPNTLQENPKSKDTPPPPEGEVLPFSSDAFKTAWAAWQTHRREKRQSLTPTTARRQLAKLGAMAEPDAVACIERSIEAGWTGLFPAPPGAQPAAPRPAPQQELLPGGVKRLAAEAVWK